MATSDEVEIKIEDEPPIEEINIEETDMLSEELIHYEYLNESPNSNISDGSACVNKFDDKHDETESKSLVNKSTLNRPSRRSRGRPPKRLIYEGTSRRPVKKSIPMSGPKRGRGRPRKHPINTTDITQNGAAPMRCSSTPPKCDPDTSPPRHLSEPVNSPSSHPSELDSSPRISEPDSDSSSNSDPDYSPGVGKTPIAEIQSDTSTSSESTNVINGRMVLKNYRRTVCRSDCIFINCALKDTAVIPNTVRIKVLQDYKLYIVKYSKACSDHIRDQNWDELLKCTYNDFSATDIEGILQLLKQGSQVPLNFEKIELISTRLIRYWMDVNKVQFQRIYEKFPSLQALSSPKTALAVYLMSLQSDDADRIALLLQVSSMEVKDMIQSVQEIIPCKTYNKLNDMFKLEY